MSSVFICLSEQSVHKKYNTFVYIFFVKSKWSMSSSDKHVGLSDVHYVCGLLDVNCADMYQTVPLSQPAFLFTTISSASVPHIQRLPSVGIKITCALNSLVSWWTRSGASMLSTSGWLSLFMRLCKHWRTPNETNVHHIAILANPVHTLEQLSFINIHTVREEARGCVWTKSLKMSLDA